MTRRTPRHGDRRPPWWFMPALLAGSIGAGALLSAAFLSVAQ
ncbi:MAG TPA: hypothetical protein VJQ78_14480 [Sphingobium sp.]|nr:hypothetical protein [Sphingobium sp.]